MICVCEHGHEFQWIRKGEKTKPDFCPYCKSTIIDVREV